MICRGSHASVVSKRHLGGPPIHAGFRANAERIGKNVGGSGPRRDAQLGRVMNFHIPKRGYTEYVEGFATKVVICQVLTASYEDRLFGSQIARRSIREGTGHTSPS